MRLLKDPRSWLRHDRNQAPKVEPVVVDETVPADTLNRATRRRLGMRTPINLSTAPEFEGLELQRETYVPRYVRRGKHLAQFQAAFAGSTRRRDHKARARVTRMFNATGLGGRKVVA